MTPLELEAVAEATADAIQHAVKAATAPLVARLAALEARGVVIGVDGQAGPEGPRGVKGDPGEPGPAGRDGKDGINGKDGAPGIDGKDGASGRDGQDGAPGPRGEKGIDGRDGKDGAPGANGIDGKDGADGVNGKDGHPGLNGKDGAPGRDGKDAVLPDIKAIVKAEVAGLPMPAAPVSVTGAFIDRHGSLVLTHSDGSTKQIGPVVGKDGTDGRPGADVSLEQVAQLVKSAVDAIPRPKDGKDGADGLGFDDMSLEFDPHQGVSLRFERGDVVKSSRLPTPYYAGIWQSGRLYLAGAQVTAKGSQWIALKDTMARPGEDDAASRDWQLCVKSGRDGKPGRDGKDGIGA